MSPKSDAKADHVNQQASNNGRRSSAAAPAELAEIDSVREDFIRLGTDQLHQQTEQIALLEARLLAITETSDELREQDELLERMSALRASQEADEGSNSFRRTLRDRRREMSAVHDQMEQYLTDLLNQVDSPDEFMSMSELFELLEDRLLESPGNPYVDVTADMYPAHLQLLQSSGLINYRGNQVALQDARPDLDITDII